MQKEKLYVAKYIRVDYVEKELCLMRGCAQCVRNGFTLDAPKRKKYPAALFNSLSEEDVKILKTARKNQWRCVKRWRLKGFCYLGDRLNASGGCETAVTARVRIGWMKFRECGELLLRRKFSLKMKGIVDRSCVRSAMLYGSETWCLRENEMIILKRTERAMVRSMCGVKLVDRKNTEDLMKMLGLKETLDKMAKANGV